MAQTSSLSCMSQGSVARLLFRFSLPAALGLVASALYNIIDRIFIGCYAGADGLGAVSLTFPLEVFGIAACSLVGIGGASQISRFLGEGRRHDAEKVLGCAFTTAAFFSVVFASAGLFWIDPLVASSGASSHLAPLTRVYTRILLWGLPFNLLGYSLNYLIRAEGFPRWAMGTLCIGALMNVFLDWLFIAHLGWGVVGAGLGTSLAQATSFVWVAVFYLKKKGALRLSAASLSPDREILREMLLLGASPFCMEIFYALSMMLYNNVVADLGGDMAISAMGIFFSLDGLIYLPAFGIGEGLQPIVGYNFGAHNSGRVKRTILCAIFMSTAYFVLSFVGAEVLTRAMVTVFAAGDEGLIDLTVRAMRIGYLGMPFAAAGFVASSAFLAIGRSGASLFLNFCREGLLFLPALLILPSVLGLDGAWSCFVVVDAGGGLVGALLLWYYWDDFDGARSYNVTGALSGAFNR